jgi:hypothetical protein
MRPVFQDRS